ncbi:uncharacterized protein METZ01_LOCUS28792 [marine metagenome]|uniref:Uncharacterized protein n=1 Tax=marine metagenome TaxID=408172 RepID=A0A381QAC6_9ZZZZ
MLNSIDAITANASDAQPPAERPLEGIGVFDLTDHQEDIGTISGELLRLNTDQITEIAVGGASG